MTTASRYCLDWSPIGRTVFRLLRRTCDINREYALSAWLMTFEWLIKGGRVIDPANSIDGVFDVGIADGHIIALGSSLASDNAHSIYDATGKIVIPGMIDLHTHVYQHGVPLGIDADHYCLGRGVTTAVDAGCAGCDTFPGFKAFAADRFRTRILAFLNISRAGLAFAGLGGDDCPGELESLRLCNVDACVNCVDANRNLLVGVKVRLSDTIADNGRNEAEAFRRAQLAAEHLKLPLMTHHTFSTVPLSDCPGTMNCGDIYTHCYHGFDSTILDPETLELVQSVKVARSRGVLFDLGHGQGSFSWTVGERCAQLDFWPDIVSTDLHIGNCEAPAYDMPTVMTRMLHLGMDLTNLVRSVTISPARAIGIDHYAGTLDVGRDADVCVLTTDTVDVELEDCQGQLRRIKKRITADAVWRSGERGVITKPLAWPNSQRLPTMRESWPRLRIRDRSL